MKDRDGKRQGEDRGRIATDPGHESGPRRRGGVSRGPRKVGPGGRGRRVRSYAMIRICAHKRPSSFRLFLGRITVVWAGSRAATTVPDRGPEPVGDRCDYAAVYTGCELRRSLDCGDPARIRVRRAADSSSPLRATARPAAARIETGRTSYRLPRAQPGRGAALFRVRDAPRPGNRINRMKTPAVATILAHSTADRRMRLRSVALWAPAKPLPRTSPTSGEICPTQ